MLLGEGRMPAAAGQKYARPSKERRDLHHLRQRPAERCAVIRQTGQQLAAAPAAFVASTAAGILLSVGGLWLMPFASYVMYGSAFFTAGYSFWPADADRHGGGECSHKEAAKGQPVLLACFAIFAHRSPAGPLAR